MQPEYEVSAEGVVTLAGPHTCDPIYRGATGWRRYFVGLDLGQAQDPSAVAIIEDERLPLKSYDPSGAQRLADRSLTVVHADRLHPMRYTDLARHAAALMGRSPLYGRAKLAIDATGVGRAFSDVLAEAGVKHLPIQMTAGSSVNRDGKFWNVSKLVMLSDVAAHLETGGLRIAGDLPLKLELRRELGSFQVAQTAAGNQVIEVAGSGHHGDMVIAIALALFASSQQSHGVVSSPLGGMW